MNEWFSEEELSILSGGREMSESRSAEPIWGPRTKAGRELLERIAPAPGGSIDEDDYRDDWLWRGRLSDAILAIEAEAAAQASAAPLPSHPDDDHTHHFSCVRCGVNPPPDEGRIRADERIRFAHSLASVLPQQAYRIVRDRALAADTDKP